MSNDAFPFSINITDMRIVNFTITTQDDSSEETNQTSFVLGITTACVLSAVGLYIMYGLVRKRQVSRTNVSDFMKKEEEEEEV